MKILIFILLFNLIILLLNCLNVFIIIIKLKLFRIKFELNLKEYFEIFINLFLTCFTSRKYTLNVSILISLLFYLRY